MASSAAGTAAAAAIANAVKASGAIIRVEPADFQTLVEKNEKPLVVVSKSTLFVTSYSYLTAYRGLIFFTRSRTPLMFKSAAEIVTAKRIWIPT